MKSRKSTAGAGAVADPAPGPVPAPAPAPASWKAEVIADSSGKWCGNALRFATKAEAEAYALDLFGRWTAVREWRAVPADGAPTDCFQDGAARPI